jgi:hypothetical protein
MGQMGACATPDGRLYYGSMFWFRVNMILEIGPDGKPGRGPQLGDIFAHPSEQGEGNPYIKTFAAAGFKGALVGWLPDGSAGIEVDQKGNLYVGVPSLPRDLVLSGELAKKVRGSVVKFGPEGGGMLPDPEECKPGTVYKLHRNPSMTMPANVAPGLKMGKLPVISYDPTLFTSPSNDKLAVERNGCQGSSPCETAC